MSLSRRDFFKYAGASAAGVAVGAKAFDLAPVEAAATSLKIKEAKAFPSVCPYCALGRLCPKGAATIQLSNNPLRPTKALYRAAGSEKWEEKPLEWMYDEIAKRVKATRDATFVEVEKGKDGKDIVVNRCEGIANLGSACIDNEECYLLTKLNRTLGIVYHEHQARV